MKSVGKLLSFVYRLISIPNLVCFSMVQFSCSKFFYNGNWTERSEIWCDVKNIKQVQCEFDLKISQVWFQTKIAQPEVHLNKYKNYKILVSTIVYWTSSWFFKKRNQKYVYIDLIVKTCQCHVSVMWLLHVIGCFVLLSYSHWLGKRCNLEQKIVQFVNREPMRLQG